MPSNDSTVKFKADISQLKSQMQAAERQIKLVNSEFKAATAGMDDWSKSADGLSAKTKQLTSVLDGQNKKLALMEKELEATVKVYGENSAAADRVRIRINEQKAAIAKTESQLKTYNQKLEDLSDAMDDAADGTKDYVSATDKLKSSISDQESKLASLKKYYADLVAEGKELSGEAQTTAGEIQSLSNELQENKNRLQEAENAADRFDNSLGEVDDAASEVSDGFTVMKGALASLVADGIRMAIDGFKDLAKEVYQVGSEFESSMSQVEAVSGATAEEMEKLTAKAEEMGAKTKFSASESADAFNYMAMAGWKTEDMINGIEGIMNLAAASGSDLATASDIVTDALTAMGYSAADAGRLADVMAAASSNANTNVEMMGATFQYAAPIIGALGMNMEDAAVAIGLMANAGIKGEKSGTALRSILTRLSAPPKECATAMEELGISLTDSEGNMKDLDEVMQDLRKAFADLDETQQTANAKAIAGQEAMSGLLAIVNAAPEDYDKLTLAVQNSAGAAKDMADTMQDNVGGQLTLLKSKIEGIMIKIFNKASNSMTKGIHSIGDALDEVDWDKVGDAVGNFSEKVADFFSYVITHGSTIITILKTVGSVMATVFVVNKIGSYVGWINKLITVYTSLNSITGVLKTSQLALNAAQLASPVGLVVAGVAALAAGMAYTYTKTKALAEAEYGLDDANKDLNRSINDNWEAQQQLNEAREQSIESTTGEFNYIKQLKDEYNTLIDSNGAVKKGYEDRANFILNELANALGVEIDTIKEEYTENGKLSASIDELIQKKQAEATLSAYDESYRTAKSNEAQALQEAIKAQNNYTEAKEKYLDIKAQYDKAEQNMETAIQNGMTVDAYAGQMARLTLEVGEAKQAMDENKTALDNANKAYQDGQTTIQNYEGLSAAIISGDVSKINTELGKLTSGFKDAKSSTQKELEEQVENYRNSYEEMRQAAENGSEVVTQEMVDGAKEMVDKAEAELDKFAPQAEESADDAVNSYVDVLKMGTPEATKAGEALKEAAKEGTDNPETAETGETTGEKYVEGVESKTSDAKSAGKELAKEAKKGADTKDETTDSEASGSWFGEGFYNGIVSWFSKVFGAGKGLAENAKAGVKEGDGEGSPAKDLIQSGKWFSEGFQIGINAGSAAVYKSAYNMTTGALNAVKSAQQEGSPSKLTYQSGRYFTQGFINGIASLEKSLVNTTKSMVSTVLKELLNLDNFNFSEVTSTASTAFSKAISKQMEYMSGWLQYQNQQMLSDFDSTISNLQDASDSAVESATAKSEKKQAKIQAKIDKIEKIAESKRTKAQKKQLKKLKAQLAKEQAAVEKNTENIKSQYESQIEEQQAMKEAYQQASSSMMSEFTSAMNEYATQAQTLIDDTMNGISDTYQSQYDALVNKQDNLIEKLKSAGDLFNISSANVMTINDIQAQTAAIKQYADKLRQIKEKVSSDLFDQIASYDMDQGEAFIDRLLAMSEAELQAYSDAYDEKMSVSEQLAEDLYQSDFDKIADEYEDAIKQAFKDLPAELETLGYQVMQGFLSGLTTNTDYMSSAIKTFVSGMIDQFKDQLGIHSPSKVAMELGAFTGEGFADGLKEMIKTVKKAANEIADATTSALDFSDSINVAKNVTSSSEGLNRNAGSFGTGTTTQVINFNQTNNSPKALDRLTLYRQTNNMLFSAKVRLSDV